MKFNKRCPFGGLNTSGKILQTMVVAGMLPLAASVHAATFDLSDSIAMDWDSTFTYGAQFRVQGPQKDLTSGSSGAGGTLDNLGTVIDNAFLINGNDGNNNFDVGIVSNRASILSEADIKWQDYGFFVRGKAWLDPVYANQATDNDDYATYNANPIFGDNGGHNAGVHRFNDSTDEYMGMNARFLDAFAYGTFYLGDHTLNLRLGRQVISWGEAMLSGGGLGTSINHVDAQIRNTPGLEIKELFLPNGAFYGQFDVTEKINVEAYYQYEWQPSILDPSGSYFSEFDSIGYGGETFTFLSGTEERIFGKDLTNTSCVRADPDCALDILKYLPGSTASDASDDSRHKLVSYLDHEETPSDNGQFGIATRFLFSGGSELGVYFVNYHEKIPSFLLPLNSMDAKYTQGFIEGLMNVGTGLSPTDPAYRHFRGAQDLGANMSSQELNSILALISAAKVVTAAPTGEVLNPNGAGHNALDYTIKYFDDVRLYGLSYSTVVGSTNVAAELTYKANTPMLGASVNRWPEREDYIQLNANILNIFGPSWFADASTLVAEVVTWNVPGRTNNSGDFNDTDALAVQNSATGWGYSFLWSFDYKNVIQGIDIVVPVYVNHGVEGAMFNSGFRNKQVTLSVGVTAKYLAALEVGMAYATYFGSDEDVFQRLTSDRDNISVNLKYGF